jgi:hypothetical protein
VVQTAARQRRKRHAKNREDALREYRLIAASITLLLAFAAPATAQSNAANDQYEPGVKCIADEANIVCTQSLEDGIKSMTEDSAEKAEAAREALSGDAPNSSGHPDAGSDDSHSTAPGDGDNSGPGAKKPETARAADTMELPDTGGAPLAALGAGVLLVGGGMLFGLRILL